LLYATILIYLLTYFSRNPNNPATAVIFSPILVLCVSTRLFYGNVKSSDKVTDYFQNVSVTATKLFSKCNFSDIAR